LHLPPETTYLRLLFLPHLFSGLHQSDALAVQAACRSIVLQLLRALLKTLISISSSPWHLHAATHGLATHLNLPVPKEQKMLKTVHAQMKFCDLALVSIPSIPTI